MSEIVKKRKCGCVLDGRGRRYWKHQGSDGSPESALCEPFGGCSHPCPHANHRTMRRPEVITVDPSGLPSCVIEAAALILHNKTPKCYESFGDEDDGCMCMSKAKAALKAGLAQWVEGAGAP